MNQRRLQITIVVVLLLWLVVAAILAWPGQDAVPEALGTPVPTETEVIRAHRTPYPTPRILQTAAAAQPTTSPAAATATAQATATEQPTTALPSSAASPEVSPTQQPTDTAAPTEAVAATDTATPIPSPTAIVHTVIKGEVLSAIAKEYGVSVAAIVAANGLASADALKIGQALVIPPPPTPRPKPH